jgi:hypothetical protein
MTRRRVLLLGSVAAAAALALAVWALSPSSAINAENAARITPGMTLAEVEAILGGPARDETDGERYVEYHEGLTEPIIPFRQWTGPSIGIIVVFSAEDGVVTQFSIGPTSAAANPLDRLRRWLGL